VLLLLLLLSSTPSQFYTLSSFTAPPPLTASCRPPRHSCYHAIMPCLLL
jgi:hypothetical protein